MAGLTAWSFLMATAHGAGLMGVPVLLGGDAAPAHAAGYLIVSALVAAVVYEKVGLRFLRTRWFNLDLLWALALIATGGLTLLA